MIEFAKFTGDKEAHLYRVRFRNGESLYAPFIACGTAAFSPTDEWVRDNKDKFLAIVSFEKDIDTNPIILGLLPVKGASTDDFDIVSRLTQVVLDLINQLKNAKINTQIGPQGFLPDTQQKFSDFSDEIENIQKLVEKYE